MQPCTTMDITEERTPSPFTDDSGEGVEQQHGPDGFHRLVEEIREILGCSAGIDDVEPQTLQDAMDRYTSVPSEWKRYALADYSRSYTRNLVDKGNGKANLLLLVWTPGKSSPIHE